MEGTLSNHGVFFNTYIASMLWPIVAAIAGIILGTRMVAADLDRGFIELPLATRIDRVRYLATGIAGQILVLAALSVAAMVGVLVVGAIVDAGVRWQPVPDGGAAPVPVRLRPRRDRRHCCRWSR